MKNKTELLAPAGDIEAGYAALYYGADAVYLGLQKFSARAGAINFDEENLNQFTAYAHSLKRKVYVAINTLVQEKELPELMQSLDICSRYHVDGIILQDLGVARIVRESYPEMELHASTQMAVHNKEGALYLKKLGFKRVVLARELSLPEIKEIASIPDLETEAFIHGALCYSYSGLCQFSSLEYGRSANRGKCAYPCRSCFKEKSRDSHIFSMKDMALESDILKMPVTSLKIEGRKKSALYVAAVTDYYRQILDGKPADINRAENIKQIFSRPWCKFHFAGKNKEVTDPDFVGHRGLKVGQIEEVGKGWIRFKPTHKICRHDGLQIEVSGFKKPFGFSAKFLKIRGKNVFESANSEVLEVALPPSCPQLQKGQAVYLASSGAVKGAYSYQKPKPNAYKNATPLGIKIQLTKDKIFLECNDILFEQAGSFEVAKNPMQTEEAFHLSFSKTGGTPFELNTLKLENPEGLFVPASLINELRRKVYSSVQPTYKTGILPPVRALKHTPKAQWVIKTDQITCLQDLDLSLFKEIIYLLDPKSELADISYLPKNKVRLALPTVCRKPAVFEKTIQTFLNAGYQKWQVGNVWDLEVLPAEKLDISFDTPLYMFNTEAIAQAQEMHASRVALPTEDTLENLINLANLSPLPTEFVVYQDAPLFTSAVCIRHTPCSDCDKKKQWIHLEQNNHAYEALSQDCTTMVFDKNPLCFATEAHQILADFYRADFVYKSYTSENVRQIMQKLMNFQDVDNALKGNLNRGEI